MLVNCGGNWTREAWARLGSHAPLPLELAIHAEECASCANFIADVKRARQLASSTKVHQLTSARTEEIRLLLRAEAQRPRAQGCVARGNQRRWQGLAVVAIGLLAGTAGVAAVQAGALMRSRLAPASVVSTRPGVVERVSSDTTKSEAPALLHESLAEGNGQPEPIALVPSAAPIASSRARSPVASSIPDDTAFAAAFRLIGSGKPSQAAVAFDGLLARAHLDPSRRADVLYWASQAHARANNQALAEARARLYVETYPNSLHYGDAALLLGDFARSRGAVAQAKNYYERALGAARPATRTRAREALALLGKS